MVAAYGLFSPDGQGVGGRLITELRSKRWESLAAAVAFVKLSGLRHLAQPLLDFGTANPGGIVLTVGIDQGGSSVEAIADLHSLLTSVGGSLFIAHNPHPPQPTFHPKIWMLRSSGSKRLLLVGSGNLTSGGLYTNYEAGVCLTLDDSEQVAVDVEAYLGALQTTSNPEVLAATPQLLQELHDRGDLPSEAALRRINRAAQALRTRSTKAGQGPNPFIGRATPTVSAPAMPNLGERPITIRTAPSFAPRNGRDARSVQGPSVTNHRFLLLTVRMDQKTEIHLAKAPLDDDPAFFGWPFTGQTTPKTPGGVRDLEAQPAPLVRARIMGTAQSVDSHEVKLWFYSAKSELRLNLRVAWQSSIPEDSVLRFERDPVSRPDLDYDIEIYPPSHPNYAAMLTACTQVLPGGQRRYGWQ